MKRKFRFRQVRRFRVAAIRGRTVSLPGHVRASRQRDGHVCCTSGFLTNSNSLRCVIGKTTVACNRRVAGRVFPLSVPCSTSPHLHHSFDADGERRGADIASPGPRGAGPPPVIVSSPRNFPQPRNLRGTVLWPTRFFSQPADGSPADIDRGWPLISAMADMTGGSRGGNDSRPHTHDKDSMVRRHCAAIPRGWVNHDSSTCAVT
jgi:hypothetical protein